MSFRQWYDLQQSLWMMDPFFIYFSMMGIKVAFFLFGTGTIKILDLSYFSLPPKTHIPSTFLPLLYFLLPNLDSSISTWTFSPPIGSLCLSATHVHTSLKYIVHSINVFFEIPSSCSISARVKFCVHK